MACHYVIYAIYLDNQHQLQVCNLCHYFFFKKKYRENKTDEQKQKQKDYQKKYKENMTDEQKKNI